ncbi:hypothetical protein NUU61_000998 [Penicillium alfredii]|uniref:alpha-galactosidase n=1 Tax=Penicillium alfredii TaxID=1506179 RepID=A0A9W9GAM5_9EURO|nr:uncharacterized protein NUU61_000998 [Penicillium alfredii]KAJ5115239.1 hypothetical protein NUU61_000998 [Penicillium alfredii]
MAISSQQTGWEASVLTKKALLCFIVGVVFVTLEMDLRAGLGAQQAPQKNYKREVLRKRESDNGSTWQPEPNTKWQIKLEGKLQDTSVDAPIYDIDLFENTPAGISELHDRGRKVICYFSAGTYEGWRQDKDKFVEETDLGKELEDWNERWLNVKSTNVQKIMQARLDLAQEKGCDGVDPDNIDGFDNDNGLGLTLDDAVAYVKFLASEASARGMSIGLKNGAQLVDSVIEDVQWSVNEQCAQFKECGDFAAFIEAGKPVFHIEYPKGDDPDDDSQNTAEDVSEQQKTNSCTARSSGKFSTVIKNARLDDFVQYC